jgi:ubiquinone/menaquinone biosynthesis C-methylase UbiE
MTDKDPLLACLGGRITPAIAIARLLLSGEDVASLRKRIESMRSPSAEWADLERLTQQTMPLERLRRMLDAASVDHAEATNPGAIAEQFDRAVAVSPEASVAMYSLGDGARLHAATQEITAWLRREQLLAPGYDVLDLGCGIGRVAGAVAPYARWILGTEISSGMLQQARVRCAGLENVSLVFTSGMNLATLSDRVFDLVLAVDTFPYFMQAGVAECHMAEIQRVLRPGGNAVVLNLSYRNRPDADRSDAETWARHYGFSLREAGCAPFSTWDALAYVFQRAGNRES